jgi:putative ABC transport system substrate-binding protein
MANTGALDRLHKAKTTAGIGRREFIKLLGGSAVTWSIAAQAQQTGKVWPIGYIAGGSRAISADITASFLQGMRELGYIEDKDFIVEWRFADEDYERLPAIFSVEFRDGVWS